MNVASLDLCKELYELSGWDSYSGCDWLPDKHGHYELRGGPWYDKNPRIPAYDLGYLLRKLWPLFMTLEAHADSTQGKYFTICFEPEWKEKPEPVIVRVWENTPEDAACKLTIELFKQGILKREVE